MSIDAQAGCKVAQVPPTDDISPQSQRPGSELRLRSQVGRRVRVRRVWAAVSQEEVAQKAQVTRNFVSAIERGAQGLDAWRLWAIADALGVRLEWLLTGPDDVLPGEG